MGAKDWRPPDLSVLLTREEEAEYQAILRRYAGKTGEAADDIRRLSYLLSAASRLSRMDFRFPAYAAFCNPISHTAYLMRCMETVVARQSATIHSDISSEVFFCQVLSMAVSDAVLFIRPYVRPLGTPSEKVVAELRSGVVELTVDGEKLAKDAGMDDFIVTRRNPKYSWLPWFVKSPSSTCLFRGYRISESELPRPGELLRKVSDPKDFLGYFLPNGSEIRMEVKWKHRVMSEALPVESGIVAARYTTKP